MKPSIAIAVALIAAACGGQVGEETVVCEVVGRTPLAAGEASPLGVSGQDVLDLAVGDRRLPLTWADDRTTAVDLGISYSGGDIEYLERAWVGDGAQELAGECDSTLSVDLVLTVVTDDGALDERWNHSVETDAADRAWLFRELDDLSGDLDIASFAPDGFTDPRAWLDLELAPIGASGAILGQASRTDGDTASAQSFDIAIIGAAN